MGALKAPLRASEGLLEGPDMLQKAFGSPYSPFSMSFEAPLRPSKAFHGFPGREAPQAQASRKKNRACFPCLVVAMLVLAVAMAITRQ